MALRKESRAGNGFRFRVGRPSREMEDVTSRNRNSLPEFMMPILLSPLFDALFKEFVIFGVHQACMNSIPMFYAFVVLPLKVGVAEWRLL